MHSLQTPVKVTAWPLPKGISFFFSVLGHFRTFWGTSFSVSEINCQEFMLSILSSGQNSSVLAWRETSQGRSVSEKVMQPKIKLKKTTWLLPQSKIKGRNRVSLKALPEVSIHSGEFAHSNLNSFFETWFQIYLFLYS